MKITTQGLGSMYDGSRWWDWDVWLHDRSVRSGTARTHLGAVLAASWARASFARGRLRRKAAARQA